MGDEGWGGGQKWNWREKRVKKTKNTPKTERTGKKKMDSDLLRTREGKKKNIENEITYKHQHKD